MPFGYWISNHILAYRDWYTSEVQIVNSGTMVRSNNITYVVAKIPVNPPSFPAIYLGSQTMHNWVGPPVSM